jgi:hypothetical protein
VLKKIFFITLQLSEVAMNLKEPKAPSGVWGMV